MKLEGGLIQLRDDGVDGFRFVIDLTDAQGVMFLCPKCYEANGGERGTHHIVCWFLDRGVPDNLPPWPGRWIPSGTCLEDLTFIGPGTKSVSLTKGCRWHGFIENGEARTI